MSLLTPSLGGLSWAALLGVGESSPGECGLTPPEGSTESAPLPALQDAETVMEATRILTLGMEEVKKVSG